MRMDIVLFILLDAILVSSVSCHPFEEIKQCQSDRDCGHRLICGERSTCVIGCRDSSGCSDEGSCINDQCISDCRQDNNCPEDGICVHGTCQTKSLPFAKSMQLVCWMPFVNRSIRLVHCVKSMDVLISFFSIFPAHHTHCCSFCIQ